jgi:hypothetical protein
LVLLAALLLRVSGPAPSFLPHALVLLGATPLLCLGAGLATGGVRHVRSGERETPAPADDGHGWHRVPVFRPGRALARASAATFALTTVLGLVTFVDYFGRTTRPHGGALLLLLAWLALLPRLLWAVVRRVLAGRSMDEARLALRPSWPVAGAPLHVRYEQEMRRDVDVRAVDLTLVADRYTWRMRSGRVRGHKRTVVRERLRLPAGAACRPGAPLRVEGAWTVPESAVPGDGRLRWRVEARTRVFGPDYATVFPIGPPEEPEDRP